MSEDQDRRKPPAPHCYRVVQLGITIRADAAAALTDRVSGKVTRQGQSVAATAIFEPKVGGGGHLLFIAEGAMTPWARFLVEPDGATVNVNAAIFEGDWEASDDALAFEAREWLRALFGISGTSAETGPAVSASPESAPLPA